MNSVCNFGVKLNSTKLNQALIRSSLNHCVDDYDKNKTFGMFSEIKRTNNSKKLIFYYLTKPGKVPKIFKVEENYQLCGNSIITTKYLNKDRSSTAALQENFIKSNKVTMQETNGINPAQRKKSKVQCFLLALFSSQIIIMKYHKSRKETFEVVTSDSDHAGFLSFG